MHTMSDQPTDSQILAAGAAVSVTNRSGVQRTIFVRQLRHSEIDTYLQAEKKGELAVLAFVTGEPVEAIDELPLACVEALVEADRVQNFTSARHVEARRLEDGRRNLEAMREQFPEQYQKMLAALEKASPSLAPSRVSFAPGP